MKKKIIILVLLGAAAYIAWQKGWFGSIEK